MKRKISLIDSIGLFIGSLVILGIVLFAIWNFAYFFGLLCTAFGMVLKNASK